jgi:hypothetical protein
MANKVLLIELKGPEDTLNPCIDAYSSAYGWTPTIYDEGGKESPNPVTSLQAAREPLRQHLMLTVQSVFVRRAQLAASDAAAAEAAGALDTITLELKLEG